MASAIPSLDELIDYVHTVTPDGDALAQLAEAMEIGRRLNEHGDHLIGHFVDQARRSGASWTAIGENMGVSKQAAQQRFVPGPSDEPRATDATLFQRFTPRARQSIVAAQTAAIELRAEFIDTEHLLLGLLTQPKGLAARALVAQGVSAEAVREAVAAAVEPATEEPRTQVPFSPRGKKVIQLSVREALYLGHNYVGTEHLLLALFSEDGVAAAVLRELGATDGGVREWVTAALSGEAA
jgi:Clp amino terminal domain, pathogenicity island component